MWEVTNGGHLFAHAVRTIIALFLFDIQFDFFHMFAHVNNN